LLQLRDEEPEAAKWVLFGGGVEDGESPEVALAREIKEELDRQIKSARFFNEYQDRGICQLIYILNEPVEIENLKLGEGKDMRFFAPSELQDLSIGFNFKQILADYLQS